MPRTRIRPRDCFTYPTDFGTAEGIHLANPQVGDHVTVMAACVQYSASLYLRSLGRGRAVPLLAENSNLQRQDWWARLRGETWMTIEDLARIDSNFQTHFLNDVDRAYPPVPGRWETVHKLNAVTYLPPEP